MNVKIIKMQLNSYQRRKHLTEQKQIDDSLPEIIPSKRMITLGDQLKLPLKKVPGKKKNSLILPNKELSSFRKTIDQNYHSIPIKGKSSIKYTKKRQQKNNYIIIQPIKKNLMKDKVKLPSIQNFQSDTYQGIRQYNEDRISINTQIIFNSEIYSFFAVYDGHGGSSVADFLKISVVKQFEKEIAKSDNILSILQKILKSIEFRILESHDSKFFGGSCVSLLVIHNYNYYTANVGDSRILRVQFKGEQKYLIEQITTDHKPENPSQKKRIQKEGGKVYQSYSKIAGLKQQIKGPIRVFPGKLSVSRTIGDAMIKKQSYGSAISSQPQLKKGQIKGKQLFLLMTDGAYQKFTNDEIVFFFTKKQCSLNLKRGIQSLLLESMIRQSCDNISIISVLTKQKKC